MKAFSLPECACTELALQSSVDTFLQLRQRHFVVVIPFPCTTAVLCPTTTSQCEYLANTSRRQESMQIHHLVSNKVTSARCSSPEAVPVWQTLRVSMLPNTMCRPEFHDVQSKDPNGKLEIGPLVWSYAVLYKGQWNAGVFLRFLLCSS